MKYGSLGQINGVCKPTDPHLIERKKALTRVSVRKSFDGHRFEITGRKALTNRAICEPFHNHNPSLEGSGKSYSGRILRFSFCLKALLGITAVPLSDVNSTHWNWKLSFPTLGQQTLYCGFLSRGHSYQQEPDMVYPTFERVFT